MNFGIFWKVLGTRDNHVCVMDYDGRILYANRPWGKFISDQESTDNLYFQESHNYFEECEKVYSEHPEVGEEIISGISALKQNEIEEFRIHSNFKDRWFRIHANKIVHEDHVYYVIENDDITDIKKKENDLQEYAQKLEESNKELQEFAYVASHDLQEPLRKIHIFSTFLDQNYKETLDADGAELIRRIRTSVERMSMLIQNLLDLSRISTQGDTFEVIDLDQVMRNVLEDLEAMILENDVEIKIGKFRLLYGDVSQIRRLFLNIISNSIKYRDPSRKTILKIKGRVIGRNLIIHIRDNGIGFDQKYAEKIFLPFQRLHQNLGVSGSGMGLSLCKKIVHRHCGTITARSRKGVGTIIRISLPL